MDTATIRESFYRDGFVIIESFFGEGYRNDIQQAIERYTRDVVPTLPPDQVFRENGATGAIKSMNRLDQHDAFFAEFKAHPRSVELMAQIFQVARHDILSESLQFFGKPAHEGSVTPWHQDNGFQHYSPPESLMFWLALDDVTDENGCVVFAAGSHELGVVPHVPSGVVGFSQTVLEPPDLERFPEVKAIMKRGSVSLHHCNTFHRSGPNRSPHARPALSVNFRTSRAQPDLEARARVKVEVARLLQEQRQ